MYVELVSASDKDFLGGYLETCVALVVLCSTRFGIVRPSSDRLRGGGGGSVRPAPRTFRLSCVRSEAEKKRRKGKKRPEQKPNREAFAE